MDLHPDQINKLAMGFNVSNQNFQNQLVAIVLLHTDLFNLIMPHMLKWDTRNIF